jgi:hypothetical protein
MAEAPYVRLNAGGPVPEELFDRRPEQALISGLLLQREYVTREAKERAKTMPVINPVSLTQLLDAIWQEFLPTLRSSITTDIASGYMEGYVKARAGAVDPVVINALAEQYVDKTGGYFHQTSREAVVQGFNTFVNRKIPVRVAAERALDAYGLTPRQMSGYTSAKFDTPSESAIPIDLKRRMREYIGMSLRQRLGIFATQEAHNLSQQAQQMAWLWMVRQGTLSENAEKVWLTARDERVCAVCGPLHGKRVKIGEKFTSPQGEVWTPGVHVNCRCEVRLVVTEVSFAKADKWYNDEIKRTSDGRFASTRARLEEQQRNPQFRVRERTGDIAGFQNLLDQVFEEHLLEEPLVEPPKPTMESKVSMRPKATMQQKATMIPKAPEPETKAQMVSGKTSMVSDKATMLGEKSSMHRARAEMRVRDSILDSIKIDMERFDAETRKTPRRTWVARSTVKLVDANGTPRPAYAVVSNQEFDQKGHIQIDRGIEFYDDQHQVAMQASEEFFHGINSVAEHLWDNVGLEDEQTVLISVDGEMKKAYLASDDVYDLVENTAHEFWPDSQAVEATYALVYKDENGEEVIAPERISHKEAKELYGLDPEMFQVTIVRLDEGYDDPSQGFTYQQEEATKYGYGTWITEGTYATYDTGPTTMTDRPGGGFVNTVALRPMNIREEVIATDESDDWNE